MKVTKWLYFMYLQMFFCDAYSGLQVVQSARKTILMLPGTGALLSEPGLLYYMEERQVPWMKTKKITLMALLTAIALTIFMVEARIPALVPIPGVKLGLSNIVTVFAVFALGPGEAGAILFCRIFLGSVFAGNFSSILYSASGGALAILVTIGLRKVLNKKQLWVAGSLGAVAHSVGQMTMAVIMTGTPSIVIYPPVMIAISIVTGLFTGLCAQFLVNRGKDLWKITSK